VFAFRDDSNRGGRERGDAWVGIAYDLVLYAARDGIFTLLSRLHYKIARQSEVHNGLRGYIEVPVACQSCSSGASAATYQAANQKPCAT
jgi:hypothetical protein